MTKPRIAAELKTVSGKRLDINARGKRAEKRFREQLNITDIAWPLHTKVRFSGHIPAPFENYSVAHHSVLVMALTDFYLDRAPDKSAARRKTLRTAGYHDAPEALIQDMPKPVKNLLPPYVKLENWIYAQMAIRFDLWPDCKSHMIETADHLAYELEERVCRKSNNVPVVAPLLYHFEPSPGWVIPVHSIFYMTQKQALASFEALLRHFTDNNGYATTK